jgi:hypothetical protein
MRIWSGRSDSALQSITAAPILQAALRGPRRRSLAEVLAAMPNVGHDRDFARGQADRRG